MTTAPGASPEPWVDRAFEFEPEPDAAFTEADQPEPGYRRHPPVDDDSNEHGWPDEAGRTATLVAIDGLTKRQLVVGSLAAAGACAALNLLLTGGHLTSFFDLCFVVICLVGAMWVRRADFFTAAVLPPLVFAAVIAAVSLVQPDAFTAPPGVNRAFLTGLATHAWGLVAGYAVTLLVLAARQFSRAGRA